MLRDQPANGPMAARALAPIMRLSLRDQLSARAAFALVGGTSLILWAGIISLVIRFWR